MKKVKKTALKPLKNKRGQGTAEYVLILVAVVGAGMIFAPRLKGIVGDKLTEIKTEIMGFTARQ